ncbi:MAG: nitrogen fixation protein NifX [Gammaproteobacteria bacterium]|nr:nitrogen fixation protein NifX [Gammaproteobacteria bacterium]
MKVAFATEDLQRVDAHFGWARHIVIYEVTADSRGFVRSLEFEEATEDGDDDKLGPRLAAIEGCTILYVAAIGGSAAARVIAKKVHPIKVTEPQIIAAILDKLQVVLQGTPPPWLRRALRAAPAYQREDEDHYA